MTDFLGLNRAVPTAPLLARDDAAHLGFETTSWRHLNRYVNTVQSLPTASLGSMALTNAVARLRPVTDSFGSPRQLRALLRDQPDALAANDPPQTLYAGAAWMIDHLRRSAISIITTLQNLSSLRTSSGGVKDALRLLGGNAEQARKAIGPMVEALKRFKTAVLDANGALAAAYTQDADKLGQMQEDVGRLTVKVDALEQKISQLGFFSSGKKQELGQELADLAEQKARASDAAETLRAALARIEPVQNAGSWLASGTDDLVGFLDTLRQALTAFGSGMTQIAADASDAQLQDEAGLEAIFGKAAAVSQWDAIAKAAESFLQRATADFSPAGGQP